MRRQQQCFVLFAVLSCLPSSGLMAEVQSAPAGQPASPQTTAASASPDAAAGGILQGHVKSGSTPMPGVSVTATNTLTGKKYTTTTDITGAFRMTIPQNGRYVLKTDLAAFAPVTKEALLNTTNHEQTIDFEILLASRAEQQATKEEARSATQYSGTGAQSLNLANALGGAFDASSSNGSGLGGNSGAQLPTIAGNSDFTSNDSVAISGQTGNTSPFADLNRDQLRQEFEDRRQQESLSQVPGQGGGDRGGPGGGVMMMMGGGPGGGGRMGNFRKFRPDQPHGAFFWSGGNSALDALPFALNGQKATQAPYNSNHFGLVFMGEPFIPKLTKPSTKDTIFFMLNGQRTSNQVANQYATVPTTDERSGNFASLASTNGTPITIYDPATGLPFTGNQIPQGRISPQALALLNYIPEPNVATTSTRNYYLLQTQQTNSTMIGTRYMRTIGNSGGGQRMPAFLAQFMNQKGLRQNINVNFNYSHNASDNVNIFPQLGGKASTDNYSVQAGYTIGYGRLTNNLSIGWNRSNGQTTNFFTNRQDISTNLGLLDSSNQPISSSPLNYGLPKVTLSQFTGLSETQPSFRVQQTISFSESSSWHHGKHNWRFGGDFRRIHLDMLSSSNATGTLYFTGFATESPTDRSKTTSSVTTGSAFADFLLGTAQESTIQAPQQKAYTRANAWDLFFQDDYRARSNLTLLYGLRYEYFSPYAEKYDHMAALDPDSSFSTVSAIHPNATGPYHGKYPRTLVYPFRLGFSPRIGFALRPMKETVLRGGYGINFTNGQYSKILNSIVYQPPFANVQTNQSEVQNLSSVVSLGNAFTPASSAANASPNFAVNPHYRLPYVQVWNLDIQRTLPMGIVLNIGYNGAKGSHLDITTAPGRRPDGTSESGVYFNYEDAPGFSSFNAATVRVRRRFQNGFSLGATYTYSHGIDNASSIGGTSTIVAQNWQDLRAEEGNSSFDQRHKINGDYTIELPFGPDKQFLNNGNWASHAFSGILVTSSFGFATGTPLSPSYIASVSDVAQGTAGSQRPNRIAGQSLTAGGGSLNHWFNKAAFQKPGTNSAGYQYGNAARNSIPGPGTISNDMSLSKTVQLGDTRSFEMRATATNVFNTVQYTGVDSNIDSNTAGYVTTVGNMRKFNFTARYRF